MNKKLKILSILILTLLIGVIIGFLISGRITSHRIESMKSNYKETGFGKEIMRIIKPTQEQRQLIAPIFRQYAQKNRELMGTMHEEQMLVFDELKESLKEVLDDDQIERLVEHWEYRKQRFIKDDTLKKHKRRGHKRARK